MVASLAWGFFFSARATGTRLGRGRGSIFTTGWAVWRWCSPASTCWRRGSTRIPGSALAQVLVPHTSADPWSITWEGRRVPVRGGGVHDLAAAVGQPNGVADRSSHVGGRGGAGIAACVPEWIRCHAVRVQGGPGDARRGVGVCARAPGLRCRRTPVRRSLNPLTGLIRGFTDSEHRSYLVLRGPTAH